MARSHHELLLARGWFQAGENRYLRRLHATAAVAVFKLSSEAGGGWGWARVAPTVDPFAGEPHPSRLSAARAAESAHRGGR